MITSDGRGIDAGSWAIAIGTPLNVSAIASDATKTFFFMA
jgi:hypothetical protein